MWIVNVIRSWNLVHGAYRRVDRVPNVPRYSYILLITTCVLEACQTGRSVDHIDVWYVYMHSAEFYLVLGAGKCLFREECLSEVEIETETGSTRQR